MPKPAPKKDLEIHNPTGVDIDLAAAAFAAGRRAEQTQLSGEDAARIFVGCITQLRPETDLFQAHRYMGEALLRAHGYEDSNVQG